MGLDLSGNGSSETTWTGWLGYVTHLTEGVVRVADGGIVDRARRTTSVGVEQTVVGPDHVRPRPTTDDSVTIVHDATEITVLVVVAVVASRLTHAQPDTLRQIKSNLLNNKGPTATYRWLKQ